MKSRNVKILVGLATGIVAVLMTVGNGCSKRGDLTSQLDSASTATGGTSAPSSTPTGTSSFIAGVKSVSVVYQKQVLDQLTACAGVESPSDATLLMYESKKGAISTYGTASSITAPMMMAVTNIAGEICNDLVRQEKDPAKTRVFVNFALGGTNPPQGATLSDAVARMSMSCWQKLPSMAETNAIVDLISTVPAGAGAADKSAILLCTAVLSSLNSLLN
jgi:hypothetical protein